MTDVTFEFQSLIEKNALWASTNICSLFHLFFKVTTFSFFIFFSRQNKSWSAFLELTNSQHHPLRCRSMCIWMCLIHLVLSVSCHFKETSTLNTHQPFLSSPYRFWYTLRYAQVLFSTAFQLRLWEVVSVVTLFLTVSKVNTLSNAQVCKCFHYNTGLFFIHLTEHVSCCRVDNGLTELTPSGWPNIPPSLWSWGFRGQWQHKSTSHMGAGPQLFGSVNSGRSSNAMSFRSCSPHTPSLLTLLVVSADTEVYHFWKCGGVFVHRQNKMHPLFFSTLTVWAPTALVKEWWIHAVLFTFWWLEWNHHWCMKNFTLLYFLLQVKSLDLKY